MSTCSRPIYINLVNQKSTDSTIESHFSYFCAFLGHPPHSQYSKPRFWDTILLYFIPVQSHPPLPSINEYRYLKLIN